MSALADVAAERLRQVTEEGWSPGYDDAATDERLARAAACYALGPARLSLVAQLWPWAWSWWKPTNRRRDLVKAAALLLAEIERLDRCDARATAARSAAHKAE